jgi:hypothetical protein
MLFFLIYTHSASPPAFGVSSRTTTTTAVFASSNDGPAPTVERGVSVDQDGKSNVWAIEPKVFVAEKSSEENTKSVIMAAGGLAGFAAFAAVVLTNLPDPNQF